MHPTTQHKRIIKRLVLQLINFYLTRHPDKCILQHNTTQADYQAIGSPTNKLLPYSSSYQMHPTTQHKRIIKRLVHQPIKFPTLLTIYMHPQYNTIKNAKLLFLSKLQRLLLVYPVTSSVIIAIIVLLLILLSTVTTCTATLLPSCNQY